MTKKMDIEKGDNLFELIFELDRRLQNAQNHSSPLKNLLEAYQYIDEVLLAAHTKQPDVVDTVFLKLVDFFIKCQCNYKRQNLSKCLGNNNLWISSVKNSSEALKRLCQLWDQSVLGDFETCLQIVNFASSCKEIFYTQTEVYGLFYEALSLFETTAGAVFGPTTIYTCSAYMQMLFDALNASLTDEITLNEILPIASFASSVLVNVYTKRFSHYFNPYEADKALQLEMTRIVIISSVIRGKWPPFFSVPKDLVPNLSNYLIYFSKE